MIKESIFSSSPPLEEVVPNSLTSFFPKLDDLERYLAYLNKFATMFVGVGLVPELKRVCMILSVAIHYFKSVEVIEKYEVHIKRYFRLLNTLGVNVDTEDYKPVIASFYKDAINELDNPVLKDFFKQQATLLLEPFLEIIPHPNPNFL